MSSAVGAPHILLVVHQFYPRYKYGTEKYTLDLARTLEELGHRVTVLTISPDKEDFLADPRKDWVEYRYEGIRVISLNMIDNPMWRFEQSYRRNTYNHVYRSLLRELKPDLIHCTHLMQHSFGFLRVAQFFDIPIVKSLTDFWPICWTGQLLTHKANKVCPGPKKDSSNCIADFYSQENLSSGSLLFAKLAHRAYGSPWFSRLLRAVSWLPEKWRNYLVNGFDEVRFRNQRMRSDLECVQTFFVATNFMLETFVQSGFPREKFVRMPFGIAQPNEEESRILRQRHEGRENSGQTFTIGFIGQFMPHKGPDLLIRAFREISSKDARLHLYGDLNLNPRFGDELKRLAGDDTRIKFCGSFKHDQVYEILSRIDLLSIPSIWHENAPLVLLNGLASKTPVAISQAKGMTEFVEPGKTGYVLPMGDIPAMTHLFEHLLANRGEFFALARSHPGYKESRQSYGAEVAKVYGRLLGLPSENQPTAPRSVNA